MPAFISFWHCIGALKYIINRVLFIAVVPKRVDTKYYIYFSFLLTCINIDRSEAKTRNSYSESEIFDTRRDKEGRWPWEMVIIMLNVVPTKKNLSPSPFLSFLHVSSDNVVCGFPLYNRFVSSDATNDYIFGKSRIAVMAFHGIIKCECDL